MIVLEMVDKGLILPEYRQDAVNRLHREMQRATSHFAASLLRTTVDGVAASSLALDLLDDEQKAPEKIPA